MEQQHRERCFTRKRMRLEDVSYADPNCVYFATLCARDRAFVFDDERLAAAVIDSLNWCRDHSLFLVYAYCLMPDHLHVALSPCGRTMVSLSDSIGRFKRFTTKASWQCGLTGQLWQRSWYDHIARRDEDVLAICQYILENPVRKQLVELAEMWPYSSMPDPLPL